MEWTKNDVIFVWVFLLISPSMVFMHHRYLEPNILEFVLISYGLSTLGSFSTPSARANYYGLSSFAYGFVRFLYSSSRSRLFLRFNFDAHSTLTWGLLARNG